MLMDPLRIFKPLFNELNTTINVYGQHVSHLHSFQCIKHVAYGTFTPLHGRPFCDFILVGYSNLYYCLMELGFVLSLLKGNLFEGIPEKKQIEVLNLLWAQEIMVGP